MKPSKRDFVSFESLSSADIAVLMDLATRQKTDPNTYRFANILGGKVIGMYFEKASMRTRLSFEAAINQLGGKTLYMGLECGRLGERESIKDFANVASRFLDAFVLRTFSHETIVELAKFSIKPVINALSDTQHPCQALGDLFTIREKLGGIEGVKVAYIGDCNNVARSLSESLPKAGAKLRIACPKEYCFSDEYIKATGVTISHAPSEAVKDADVVYTDVWASMGQESEAEKRRVAFQPYQVNADLMRISPNALFMHCLPAHRGEEVTDEVMDGPQSVVYDQAENRMHAQRALLSMLLG